MRSSLRKHGGSPHSHIIDIRLSQSAATLGGFKATDSDTVKKFLPPLMTTLAIASTHAWASDTPLRITAPAGATVKLPEGQWQASDSAQALAFSGEHVKLPMSAAPKHYRLSNGEQHLDIEQTVCTRKIGGIFDDCLDGLWEGFGSHSDGPRWSIQQQGDNWLLDVAFTSDTPFSIQSGAHSDPDTPNEWADLRAFAQGTLSFDLKVLDFGNNLNGLEVGIGGALQPVTTLAIHPLQVNQWQSYSIALQTFIEQGATLGQIQQGFVLKAADGEFEGVHVQIDNIRLSAPVPDPMDWALL